MLGVVSDFLMPFALQVSGLQTLGVSSGSQGACNSNGECCSYTTGGCLVGPTGAVATATVEVVSISFYFKYIYIFLNMNIFIHMFHHVSIKETYLQFSAVFMLLRSS